MHKRAAEADLIIVIIIFFCGSGAEQDDFGSILPEYRGGFRRGA